MTEKGKNTEKKNIMRGLFSGDMLLSGIIAKQGGYLLFLVALAMFYIGFHYHMAHTVQQVRNIEREVENLKAEYSTKSSELMRMSKQSEISRMLKELNVTTVAPPKVPPKKINKN
jgi:hypothetical protein